MAGLPKKYAKMGFKKGWQLYKKTKSSKSKKATTKTLKVRTVAKKRRSYKKKSNNNKSMMNTFVGKLAKKAIPIVYGATRDNMSDWIANTEIGKKLPAFSLIDEATMLGINWGLTALGARKNPIARRALQAVEDIELASVGRELSDMFSKGKGKGSSLFS